VVRATIAALKSLRNLEQVAQKRGKQTEDLIERKAERAPVVALPA
jgi:ribosomal protein S5